MGLPASILPTLLIHSVLQALCLRCPSNMACARTHAVLYQSGCFFSARDQQLRSYIFVQLILLHSMANFPNIVFMGVVSRALSHRQTRRLNPRSLSFHSRLPRENVIPVGLLFRGPHARVPCFFLYPNIHTVTSFRSRSLQQIPVRDSPPLFCTRCAKTSSHICTTWPRIQPSDRWDASAAHRGRL